MLVQDYLSVHRALYSMICYVVARVCALHAFLSIFGGPAKAGVQLHGYKIAVEHVAEQHHHKHGSAYSRTEPENAKTGGQDLSPSARWPRTEVIYVFI